MGVGVMQPARSCVSHHGNTRVRGVLSCVHYLHCSDVLAAQSQQNQQQAARCPFPLVVVHGYQYLKLNAVLYGKGFQVQYRV